jgi:hypothetical protein
MQSIIEAIINCIFEIIVNIFLICTGEIIISICTIGTRPVPWKIKNEPIMRSMVIFELSFWVGLFFWIFLIGILAIWFSL